MEGWHGPAWPLHLGWFLPPLLALGFSDGYKACLAPPSPGSLTLVFQQDWASAPRPAPLAPSSGSQPWGVVQRPRGFPQRPQMPPLGARPPAQHPCPLEATPGSPQPPVPAILFCFYSSLHPSPSDPIINFLCMNRTLLVRKQYHFRSKEERDVNLVEGKFSFAV